MTEKSIGEQLKQAREKKHLSLVAVAEALHIRQSYLQFLEENQFDQLPSKTQLRGFIRMYATHIGLEPQSILEQLDPQPQPAPTTEILALPSEKTKLKPQAILESLLSKNKKVPKQELLNEAPVELVESKPSAAYGKILQQIGNDLIARRKKLGLSLDEVEKHTHIRKTHLDAIETGRIDDLPSTIQGRGLLSNYAEFLDLDPDPLLVRFAEALQSRLDAANPVKASEDQGDVQPLQKILGFARKYLTVDLLIGATLILTLFVFVFWGAAQLISSTSQTSETSAPPASGLPAQTEQSVTLTFMETPMGGVLPTTSIGNSSAETLLAPIVSVATAATVLGNASLQLNVTASESAFLRVTADGKQVFNARVIAGNAYPFSANQKIELITGNAAALQITFNGSTLGSLGTMGQVIDLVFTSAGVQTPTPILTPTVTPNPKVNPTRTQQISSTSIPPTLTPLVTTSKP